MGMGGSGISGDVAAAALNDELPVPITVLKQMRVPAFVGPETLAFAVSYSGDTEETVSMATSAVEKGAQKTTHATKKGVSKSAGAVEKGAHKLKQKTTEKSTT